MERRKKGWEVCLIAVGILSLAECTKHQNCSNTIQILDVTGTPLRNVAVLAVRSEAISQGWWEQSSVVVYTDTLKSDANGRIELPLQDSEVAWNALLIELQSTNKLTQIYHLPLPYQRGHSGVQKVIVPGTLTIQFVGNRIGTGAANGCWILDDTVEAMPDTTTWFTPGHAPFPTLFKTTWIHPHESFPVHRSFRMLSPSGGLQEIPDVVIQAEHVGDTLIHSIES